MKRLMMVLAIAVLAAACSSGGDSSFNFNGRWLITSTWKQMRCVWTWDATEEVDVVQPEGTSTITVDGHPGSANPKTGTFGVTYVSSEGVTVAVNGQMTSDETMTGTSHSTYGPCYLDMNLKGELLHR
jgi:hypothetical protein